MKFLRKRLAQLIKKADGPVHLTANGFTRLKEKLADVKHRLPELIEETRRTAAYGDRSDNEAYKEAKLALRRANWQALTLEDQIKRAVLIKSGPNTSGKVELGSTVVLKIGGEKKTFEILGSHETDPARGRISYESPLGAALMNRSKGDTVTIEAGKGSKTYRIVAIR
ncbi:MAG: GreA/GreB family elongation factor [bacterium]|nr:GreA/GreB family elongation factor [bacterium]